MKQSWFVCGIAGWIAILSCPFVTAQPNSTKGPGDKLRGDGPLIAVEVVMVIIDGAARERLGLAQLNPSIQIKDARESRAYLHDLRKRGIVTRYCESKIVAVSGQTAWALDGMQVFQAPPAFRWQPGSAVTVLPTLQANEKIHLGYTLQMTGTNGGAPFPGGFLQIADGETVFLSGGFATSVSQEVSKTPVLGDLPFLGHLFQKCSSREVTEETAAMITVRRLRDFGRADVQP